jgi:hypothetical protein
MIELWELITVLYLVGAIMAFATTLEPNRPNKGKYYRIFATLGSWLTVLVWFSVKTFKD